MRISSVPADTGMMISGISGAVTAPFMFQRHGIIIRSLIALCLSGEDKGANTG